MKIRIMVLGCVIGLVVLFMGHEYSLAESKAAVIGAKIGVVSIRKVFGDCKKNVGYRKQADEQREKISAELNSLSKEIEAEKAGLKTLKTGSSDYMARVREILEKQASLQARQEFEKQQLALNDQQWTEQLYIDILRIISEVAKQEGLDLVLEKDEIELPLPSANELMMTIRTHKLLYSGGCPDITDEIITRLDKEN